MDFGGRAVTAGRFPLNVGTDLVLLRDRGVSMSAVIMTTRLLEKREYGEQIYNYHQQARSRTSRDISSLVLWLSSLLRSRRD